MKVTVNIDCTPEEARSFFGLPDLKPMQDRILAEIEQRLRSGLGAMDPTEIFRTWLPASMQGVEQMQQMQQMFWSQLAAAAGGKGSDRK
jgi:hypothetical protein